MPLASAADGLDVKIAAELLERGALLRQASSAVLRVVPG
jgi:hypothetical protein